MKRSKARRKRIVITGVADMEDNAASVAMVNALASRIETVIKELGLTARIRIGKDAKAPRPKPLKHTNPRGIPARPPRAPKSFGAHSRSAAVDRLGRGPDTEMEEGRR